jgi:hypothetical protein
VGKNKCADQLALLLFEIFPDGEYEKNETYCGEKVIADCNTKLSELFRNNKTGDTNQV